MSTRHEFYQKFKFMTKIHIETAGNHKNQNPILNWFSKNCPNWTANHHLLKAGAFESQRDPQKLIRNILVPKLLGWKYTDQQQQKDKAIHRMNSLKIKSCGDLSEKSLLLKHHPYISTITLIAGNDLLVNLIHHASI